ncbi:MAG: zinc-dependent alcohol dehydrogenase family protein [Myxococcota bacterium]
MKVARFANAEGPEALEIRDEAIPEPGAGQVRLKMKALGLNRAEALFLRGQYLEAPDLPSRIGIEGAGVVDAVGDGVDESLVGTRAGVVCAVNTRGFGVAGEYAVVNADMLLPDIASFDDESLAAFWVAYLTAYEGLIGLGQLQKRQSVILTAASSSVGLAGLQIAASCGAQAIATTRTKAKAARLKEAGADDVIITSESEGFGEDRFDVAFDAVAGPSLEALAMAMKSRGRMVVYGLLDGLAGTPFPAFPAFAKNLSLTAFHAGYHILADPARREPAVAWLLEHAPSLKPTIDRVFPFDELPAAYEYLEASGQFGKIVVKLEG